MNLVHRSAWVVLFAVAIALSAAAQADEAASAKIKTLEKADGFRGIWYANQPSGDEYKFKYSGGLATYPQQHLPIAIHAPAAGKTFFCYGGRYEDKNRLLHMLSYYDHARGKVARPRILLDKQTSDAHDNPTMALDTDGHLWIFSNSHGTGRPSYIHRSTEPHSIDAFELIETTNFSYGQPWHLPDFGFVFLHTRYVMGRRFLHMMTSPQGRSWSEPTRLASVAEGHYQVSWAQGSTLATVFNYHPLGKGLNYRTNLYYMQTTDGGGAWTNVRGEPLSLPLTEPDNAALAVETESQGLLVYLKDLAFTADGAPVALYMTSKGYESGPKNDPRRFTTARWTGESWETRDVAGGDNNYDFASLYIEPDGAWRMIGATEQGPQQHNTGGEIALWLSHDQGAHWTKERQLTRDSPFNHTYPRKPVNAHADFYALWADGDARAPSASRLYFTNRDGSQVFRLPERIPGEEDLVAPEPLGEGE